MAEAVGRKSRIKEVSGRSMNLQHREHALTEGANVDLKVVEPAEKQIEKDDVENVVKMRAYLRALKNRIALVEAAIHRAENNIITRIEGGSIASELGFTVKVKITERRCPRWKQEFILAVGEERANEIIAQTPASLYRRLVIRKD